MADYGKLIAKALAAAGLGGAGATVAPDEAQAGFFGKLSPFFKPKMAQQAEQLLKGGASPQTIRQETGLHLGAEDQPKLGPPYNWRGEFSDVGAKFRIDPKYKYSKVYDEAVANATPIEDWLKHSLLFKHYPELRGIRVMSYPHFKAPGAMGFMTESESGRPIMGIAQDRPLRTPLNLTLPPPLQSTKKIKPEEMLSTALHEVAGHGVQHIEGWPGGGNLASPGVLETARDILQRPSATFEDLMQSHNGQDALFEAYKRLWGETQARNIQTRAFMPPEMMAHPYATQEYPFPQQIPSEVAPYQPDLGFPWKTKPPVRRPPKPTEPPSYTSELNQYLE